MSTIEIIGKHDVLCSSLNFATPEGAAECDCNLSVMADMLEALEDLTILIANVRDVYQNAAGKWLTESITYANAIAAIAKAKGGA